MVPPLTSDEFDFRMEEWCKWSRSSPNGAVNGSEGSFRERLDRATDPEMSPVVEIMERAICLVKIEHRAYWRIISRHYLGRLSAIEIASFFNKPERKIQILISEVRSRICENVYLLENNLYNEF